MDIKLIAIDVDGTLVADDHLTIPQINIDAVKRARENGIKVTICTGRTYSLTDKEADALGGVDYFILSNGAIVIDAKTMEPIYDRCFPVDVGVKIVKIMEKYPLIYEIYVNCKGNIGKYTYEHFMEVDGLPQVFLKEYRERMAVCDDLVGLASAGNVEKININGIPEEIRENFMEDLKNIPGLVYSAGYKGNMEITMEGADKGEGLRQLANTLGIVAENIMAFGDSGNDVTMLEYAQESYAMISGNEKAKAAAKHITKLSNSRGGVGDVIIDHISLTK